MSVVEIKIPNIGDFKDIPIIEILVRVGDEIRVDDPLITLESDKAAMEIPAPLGGKVAGILVGVGDRVSEGSLILHLDTAKESAGELVTAGDVRSEVDQRKPPAHGPRDSADEKADVGTLPPQGRSRGIAGDVSDLRAGPSVRRIARELNVDLTKISGTGDRGRITKEDVKAFIAGPASENKVSGGIPEIPVQDFAKFGPIESKPLTRLKRLSGPHLHRAWLNVPHVTNSDEADITELDVYRHTLDSAAKAKGYRVTLVSFLLKACISALKEYPELNSSLAPAKDALILKRFYNIGVAVDTPDGLVVPVIKDADRKGVLELSEELSSISSRMREGRIAPADIQGGTFSISSLGGIGGTNFTPIINAPEVAILGVLRANIKPIWDGAAFKPRLMLPLCLSYDHRAIDGVLAARFLRKLADVLNDMRQLVL